MNKYPLSCSLQSLRPLRASAMLLALLVAMGSTAWAQGLRATSSLPARAANTDTNQRQADYIVAIVNSEPVTNNEVRARVIRFEQQLAQRGGALPERADLMQQVLDRLISERAQVQLARDTGMRVEESAVDSAVENVARQNQLSLEELRRRLDGDGISFGQFREDLRNEILLTRVREREVEPRVRISEQDLDAFVREQRESTLGGEIELNLAQILVAIPENSSPEQVRALQTRAEQIAQRVSSGQDFAALAREFSDAPDRSNGGVLGLRSADRYPPLFVDATQALNVGAVSALVRSGAGFHILKVMEKKQAGVPNMSLVQSRARHILLRSDAQLSESAARTRMADIRQRIAAGQTDFASAAREHSQDGSGKDGGDLGWANPGQFVPEFEEAMNALKPGEMSQPIISRFGIHLIQLMERRDKALDDREQRESARGALRERKLDEAYTDWAQEVRGRAYVELREPPR